MLIFVKNTMKSFPNSFLEEAARCIKEGHTVKVCVGGSSMLPFLKGSDDKIFIAPCAGVKAGDIVFFYYRKRYIVHRVVKVKDGSILIRGDGSRRGMEIVSPSQVLGKVVRIQKSNGREYDPYTPWRRLAAALWQRLFFMRRYLLFIYRKVA